MNLNPEKNGTLIIGAYSSQWLLPGYLEKLLHCSCIPNPHGHTGPCLSCVLLLQGDPPWCELLFCTGRCGGCLFLRQDTCSHTAHSASPWWSTAEVLWELTLSHMELPHLTLDLLLEDSLLVYKCSTPCLHLDNPESHPRTRASLRINWVLCCKYITAQLLLLPFLLLPHRCDSMCS